MPLLDASTWRAAVAEATGAGFTEFVTLMGIDDDGPAVWLRLRNHQGEDRVLMVAAGEPVPTIVDLLPGAAWCEREAAEMYGLAFSGHDTAPLLLSGHSRPPMPKSNLLESRQSTPWPGEKDPGGVTARRRTLPPGVAGGAR